MRTDPPPRPTDVGREELTTTSFERFLAVILAVFLLIGLLWLYAEPLDRTDDVRYDDSLTYVQNDPAFAPQAAPAAGSAPQAAPPPAAPPVVAAQPAVTAQPAPAVQTDAGPVGEPRPGDQELVRRLSEAATALGAANGEVSVRTDDVGTTREAYRTRLDAGEPADRYRQAFLAAEKALADAKTKLASAQAAFDRADLPGRQAQQRLAKAADDERRQRERQTFLLRLALTLGSLALSGLMLHQLHRRRPRYVLPAMSAVAAATGLAIVMTGDYLDVRRVGPIVVAIAGTAVTLAVFVAYQRRLARRLPERRVRKGECPFCGYPARDGTYCQGCGRETVAPCTTCSRPRRVGARHCAACGAG
jgi:hypothetical protein